MLGVSVSRETLTPNAGYVVGILLRPALAKLCFARVVKPRCASSARSLAVGC